MLAQGDGTLNALLGVPVTYAPAIGAPVTVQGVFDANAVTVDAGSATVSSSGPQVFLRRSDLPEDPANPSGSGPTITINGLAYIVRDVRADGLDGVLILLHKST